VQPAISSVQEVKEPVQASTEIAAPVQAEKSDSETTVSVVEPSAEANVDAKAETVAEPAAEPVAAPFVETQAADVATNRATEEKE
jgi:hypothetical protein